MSFEEAATVPLAMFTAAVGLYQNLGYRAPWERKKVNEATKGVKESMQGRDGPVVIWGGGTAVGEFVIKFAEASGLGPIITLAGRGKDL